MAATPFRHFREAANLSSTGASGHEDQILPGNGHALIEFVAADAAETRDLDENTILDLDDSGRICAITVEHASERMVISREYGMDPLERLRSLRGALPAGYGAEVLRERGLWDDSPNYR